VRSGSVASRRAGAWPVARRLQPGSASVGASLLCGRGVSASASPIPLYQIYRRSDRLTKSYLALTAVAYFVAVMAALLVLGRLSNHLGRRPVSLAALALAAVDNLILIEFHGVAPLLVERARRASPAVSRPVRLRRSSSTARRRRRPGSPARSRPARRWSA
jgi:hypothetical protein